MNKVRVNKKLIILVDDNKNFLISIDNNHKYCSMDIERIALEFSNLDWDVTVIRYSDFNPHLDYKNVYILYHITEDNFVIYKSYVEDIINYLKVGGAILLPCVDYARAHHNKVYMELLRMRFTNPALKTIHSNLYGNVKEALNASGKIEYPVVIKIANGAGSRGVALAHNKREYIKKVKSVAKGTYYSSQLAHLKQIVKMILCALNIRKYNIDKYYSKIITQNYIANLSGDYKVLYFGGKYYTLKRLNRRNDFRASGSGRLFEVSDSEISGLLSFAKKLVCEIDFPIIGMDIGYDGENYHLIEFQMVHLGPYALCMSEYYHVWQNGNWDKIYGKSNLEVEFCRSIDEYVCGVKYE